MKHATRRVLVVEDESSQRLMYKRALTTMGFDVIGVESGEKAKAQLGTISFAIILLDLNLGGEHGLDLFEHIREHYPAVSVVIATGYGTFSLAKQAIRMDVVDFLSKPISITDLESAMNRAWSRYQLVHTPVADLLPPRSASSNCAFYDALDLMVSNSTDLNFEAIERTVIMEALRRSKDNRKVAAKMLGISERTLYYRLSQYRYK